jgi:hypothetical protein
MRYMYLIAGVLFISMFCLSCNKESDIIADANELDLKGIWYEETFLEEEQLLSRLEYHFMDDSILEVYRMELNPDTRKIVTYRFKAYGTYHLQGNELSFTYLKTYKNDTYIGSVAYHGGMQYVGEDVPQTHSVTVEMSKDESTLVFYYPPCPLNANCVDYKVLRRQL